MTSGPGPRSRLIKSSPSFHLKGFQAPESGRLTELPASSSDQLLDLLGRHRQVTCENLMAVHGHENVIFYADADA